MLKEDKFYNNVRLDAPALKKALDGLKTVEDHLDSDCMTRAARAKAIVYAYWIVKISAIEESLGAQVDDCLGQASKLEKKRDYEGAMFRLFRALCFRRKMNEVKSRIGEVIQAYEAVKEGGPPNGGTGSAATPAESAADLTPELRSLALEALHKGLSSELGQATDQEIDFYWRKELGISADTFNLRLISLGYETVQLPSPHMAYANFAPAAELLLKYLAVSARNDWSEKSFVWLLRAEEEETAFRVTKLFEEMQGSLDAVREAARETLNMARKYRDEPDQPDWRAAKEAFRRYDDRVRDCIGCPGYDPKADQEEIERALKEIDERIVKE
ncbi:MAG: hypothetical protein ACLQVA_16235 [Candidatus Brocadiia bacterium]